MMRFGTAVLVLLAGLVMLLSVAACGGLSGGAVASPEPAVSVSSMPRWTYVAAPSSATHEGIARGMIEVFIKDEATPAQTQALARRIADMPEVLAYHFASKGENLEAFRKQFPEIVANLPINPLPASFQLLVRSENDITTVAQRFYEDPAVDSDPGTHNGVKTAPVYLLEPWPRP
jgi:hypothetical protein